MTNITFEKLSRTAATGNPPQSGSGEGTQYNPHAEILLPAGSIASPVSVLKQSYAAQAIIDGLAMIVCLLFLAALIGSVPLAIFLMIIGVG
ncbi:hypothetical protein JEY40_24760 [Bradyrhizobium japonicum]|uniref:hypothetical protein n=1 Tax=Bradyrhizobium japonicum TaxID=375 RepID=UPI00200E4D21|nr:hypothetical protein [Bradyrhizobium japonicum]UQD69230.1 hypothetical protein JEY40_24760 [Bradyrhizobium japonicum]WAX24493.1 hypothetical protein [Bradyrhizobium phage ppBjS10J-1]